MRKKIIAIFAGVLIIGAIAFTQIPALRAKADTINNGYGFNMMGSNFNYSAMYNYMKGLTAKDVQNMMGGNIDEKDAQNMLNACTNSLKNEINGQQK
ncbi:hypothetical protein [Thermoanaerobacterium thermosaccharolyticum]|uniref:Uncharacterized protein n=1 Tax=Thermoanaerobacterium thermosaccharolyticum M0795 TaxID=698948 RepID=L0IJJ9_THETR|nr:hypothetical protein [Thermoanaerobacterium thermosaccharolyticum]AGB18401.1 hypothetical protein Thethe_00714 [Thermoanaerobacterium thermosaccharolyticum M0795]